jgi:hypothetical protein
MTDENPNQVASADAEPKGAPASQAEPNPAGDEGTVSLNDLALEKARVLQSTVDQSIVHLERGEFDKLPPKVVQLLSKYEEISRPGNPGAAATPSEGDPYDGIFGRAKPEPTKANSKLEEVGRQKLQADIVAELKGEAEAEFLKQAWSEDVRALFNEIGDMSVTQEDFATVDITDKSKFPFSRAGYQKWLRNAETLRTRLVGDAGKNEAAAATAKLTADKGKATKTKRTPAVNQAGSAIESLADATKARRSGAMSREDFVARVKGLI